MRVLNDDLAIANHILLYGLRIAGLIRSHIRRERVADGIRVVPAVEGCYHERARLVRLPFHGQGRATAGIGDRATKGCGVTLNVKARYLTPKNLVWVLVPEGEASRTTRRRAVEAGPGVEVYFSGCNYLPRGLRLTKGGERDRGTRLRYERDHGRVRHAPGGRVLSGVAGGARHACPHQERNQQPQRKRCGYSFHILGPAELVVHYALDLT